MLKFLDKSEVWSYLDAKSHTELGWKNPDIHLKTWQDVAVYDYVKDQTGKRIAEVGGGNSRILRKIAAQNDCVNIDRLIGEHGGPVGDQGIPDVVTVNAFLGDKDPRLADNSFDYVISVSVIEHVANAQAGAFLDDMLRILKPGGIAIHAIDMYVADIPLPHAQSRLDLYADWLRHPAVRPLGPVLARKAVFSVSMASNPDLTMWHWNTVAPALQDLRLNSQSVSLLLGFTKI